MAAGFVLLGHTIDRVDVTTKDGTKVHGAILNGKNFKGMYSFFNEKYFGNSLPDISVY
jgi:hypothetical protein